MKGGRLATAALLAMLALAVVRPLLLLMRVVTVVPARLVQAGAVEQKQKKGI